MSVFGKIKDAIFGRHAEAAENPTASQPTGANSSAVPGPQTTPTSTPVAPAGTSPEAQSMPPQTTAAPAAPAPTAGTSAQPASTGTTSVDVERIMDAAVKASGQKLDWRHSIVDMMKALDLDSSLSERKELATELGFDGDENDSAHMNVWLHKALMQKLAENGGKIPAGLAD